MHISLLINCSFLLLLPYYHTNATIPLQLFLPQDFAAQLLLPNVYTGYAYLLDRDNKVRWRGSGQATEQEIEAMLECTEQLLQER